MAGTENGTAKQKGGGKNKNKTTATTTPTKDGAAPPQSSAQPPALCRMWVNLHDSLPRTPRFDFSVTLATIALLTALRFLSEYVQVHAFGWPSEGTVVTKEAAGSVVAIFHSLNLVPALVVCFYVHGYSPSERLSSAPHWYQTCVVTLLQFCTGYMVYDGLLNVVGLRWEQGLVGTDYLFLGHHLATALYMTSARVVGAGHVSAMMCMLLGESTNPLHNAFFVAQFAQDLDCCNGPTSQLLYRWIGVAFSATYVLVRTVIGPIVCAHMTYDLWRNGPRNGIPRWLLAIWTFLIWAVIIGSVPWIQDCYQMLQKGLNNEPISSEL